MDTIGSVLYYPCSEKALLVKKQAYFQTSNYFLKAGVRECIQIIKVISVVRGVESLARILVAIPRDLC